jgi:hypothetical protein
MPLNEADAGAQLKFSFCRNHRRLSGHGTEVTLQNKSDTTCPGSWRDRLKTPCFIALSHSNTRREDELLAGPHVPIEAIKLAKKSIQLDTSPG